MVFSLSSLCALACVPGASGNMYDAFSPELVAPAKCKHGCADWSTQDPSIWNDGKVPAEAGNKCAHVASQVNAKTLGAWCYCAAAPRLSVRDDHPLDGMTYVLQDHESSLYTSFAYTAKPDGQDDGSSWIRATYSVPSDAMPLLFKAVDGQKDTYTLLNQWPGYEHYVTHSKPDAFLRADAEQADATPFRFVEQDGTYILENRAAGLEGKFLKLGTGSWLQTKAAQSEAMKVKLQTQGGGGDWDYCGHAEAVPEQVNIQVAGPDSVVVAFVTFESSAPTEAPSVFIGKDKGKLAEIKGETHEHKSPGGRVYYLHFVLAEKLEARQEYFYQVASGGAGAGKSDVYSFRAPYADGETRMDIYGDMGIYSWNNLEQLHKDCVQSKTADLIVHMGDISYNMGDGDEARADGFFSAFQQTIARCPWLPNVGNHEYYSSEELARYLDGTWQQWGPVAGGSSSQAASTATSALGAFLTRSMHRGPGLRGNHPSNTSRYFSLDFGLVHLIALDMNMYFGVDPCGEPCRKAQLEWLEEDLKLANANRDNVPWVLAFSHYPLYCSGCNAAQVSAEYYASDDAEFCGNGNVTAAAAFAEARGVQHLGAAANSNKMVTDMHPLFAKYSLDLYLAGHWHYYESLWPVSGPGESCKACGEAEQKSFDSPTATVHVTTGNGGPPSKDTFCESGSGAPDCGSIPATRKQTNEYSFGRVVAHNRTHLTFQQLLNADGSVFDEWTIHQPKHPFAAAETLQV